jgi:hypothetical protein
MRLSPIPRSGQPSLTSDFCNKIAAKPIPNGLTKVVVYPNQKPKRRIRRTYNDEKKGEIGASNVASEMPRAPRGPSAVRYIGFASTLASLWNR